MSEVKRRRIMLGLVWDRARGEHIYCKEGQGRLNMLDQATNTPLPELMSPTTPGGQDQDSQTGDVGGVWGGLDEE